MVAAWLMQDYSTTGLIGWVAALQITIKHSNIIIISYYTIDIDMQFTFELEIALSIFTEILKIFL